MYSLQGGCGLYKIKFKDNSRTFQGLWKKIQGHKKLFIHPWKPLPETISELAFFDAILLGLKHFTFLIKSCFRLGYGPVLDKDPHSTDPYYKAPTIIFFEHTFQTILQRKEKCIMKNFVLKKMRNFF